jgi:signal transduction histidine kinase
MSATTGGDHVEAVELIVELLSSMEDDSAPDELYSRLCEALCRLTAMRRAVMFRYDDARRRVRATGAHGIELGRFTGLHVTVESVPVARRALAEDRVLEVTGADDFAIPASLREAVSDVRIICTPMSAAGRWVGVVLSEREPLAPPLSDRDRQLLLAIGKTAALAGVAQTATMQGERARQLQHRLDLARDIHESVMQRLFGLSLALSSEEPLDLEAQRRCSAELQSALGELRAALQRPLGRSPRPTLVTLAEELERLRSLHPDLHVQLVEGDPASVPPGLEALSQSVLTEAIRNAHKHARPTRVDVAVRHEGDAFVLEVSNDGVQERAALSSGMGLRLAALEALGSGGVVEFGPRDGVWQVRLVVPDVA